MTVTRTQRISTTWLKSFLTLINQSPIFPSRRKEASILSHLLTCANVSGFFFSILASLICPWAISQTPNVITIQTARQGCLDIQPPGNMTGLVSKACNGKTTCSFQSPGQQPNSATRTFCTQGMEITFRCTNNTGGVVTVPGDAWSHGPTVLTCSPATLPAQNNNSNPSQTMVANLINVVTARQGCLDIQPPGNMTTLVGNACDHRSNCSFKSPGQVPNSVTRTFCTQGMEITYECTDHSRQVVTVPGDAWNNGPAELACTPATIPQPGTTPGGVTSVPIDPELTGKINIITARQGCLDIQPPGNMTTVVGRSCDGLSDCEFKAPNGNQPGSVTRTLCTQQLEITYQCGQGGAHTVSTASYGDGDAWSKPPLSLSCSGESLIAENYATVNPTPTQCTQPEIGPPAYFMPPSDMLDWTPTVSQGQWTLQGFRPPEPAADPSMYRTDMTPVNNHPGTPASVLGANEGRLRGQLRAAAAKKDPINDLCQAAIHFTQNHAATSSDPSDQAFGNAFADLAVTGRAAFAAFVAHPPTESILQSNRGCAGASPASLTQALNRAYSVAIALRLAHDSPQRQALGWVAISGEDDQPYLPVDVPGTEGTGRGSFPLFHIPVTTNNITVNVRYMIAHSNPPQFPAQPPLINLGSGRTVPNEPRPALAPDAEVILFIHGLDSKSEEALDLTKAMHRQQGHNWTIISMDLPSSGYTDNIDSQRISPLSAIGCHSTPALDFLEDFVVQFVDALDHDLNGALKPRIRAVVGGSLGGNLSMRLGRRDDLLRLSGKTADTPWIQTVVPWSPASIWTSFVGQTNCVACGCDTGWDATKDFATQMPRQMAGMDTRFLPQNETPELRREMFYGCYDWDGGDAVGIFSTSNHKPQAECWFDDSYVCKERTIQASRLDRHETYDADFRSWHWRLAAEQLIFSHQLNRIQGGPTDPLYLHNTKQTVLFSGANDVCASLGQDTFDVAKMMTNTPGFYRFLNGTGHSLDNEHPDFIATEIAQFLNSRDGAMTTEPNVNRNGGDYMSLAVSSAVQCRTICSEQDQCKAYTYVNQSATQGMCWLKGSAPAAQPNNCCTSGVRQ